MRIIPNAFASAAALAVSTISAVASGTLFHGVIQWANPADPIIATEQWASPFTSLTWDITYSAADPFPWHYEYSWTTSEKGLSHLIIEVSTVARSGNFSGLPGGSEGPRTFSPSDPGNSTPGLPGDIWGIKYDGGGVTSRTISFSSTQSPTWGDFYAKDGVAGGGGPNSHNDVYAYNAGFLQPDPLIDLVAINNGIYTTLLHTGPRANHIAVPDTLVLPPVVFTIPEASTGWSLLGLAGVVTFVVHRNRKNRSETA